ncbi:MAG: hypothetical protein PHX05_05645 [Acidobacteriota bacterium]|jgi:hypothetical protein|nr:hypothetical protein [Acidobacteriota bacterium]
MGLSEFFLPERLPQQLIYAGDGYAEIVTLAKGRVAGRRRLDGADLVGEAGEGRGWNEVMAGLRPEETGIVFNASPFIFNFFDFDKLPWRKKALGELVAWRLQKIFPGDIASYDHRFYRLDRRRILSILAPRALAATAEAHFREKGLPLTFIGSTTMTLLPRMAAAKPAPDFLIESDGAACTMLFQDRRAPIYIRKFRGSRPADTVEEVVKTVAFVRGQYGIEPRRYWLIDHHDSAAAIEAGLASLADGAYSRLQAGLGEAPHIPGSR